MHVHESPHQYDNNHSKNNNKLTTDNNDKDNNNNNYEWMNVMKRRKNVGEN